MSQTTKQDGYQSALPMPAPVRMENDPLSVNANQLPMGLIGQQIVCAGDSLTAGLTSPNTISYPQALALLPPVLGCGTVTNYGVPGAGITGLNADYATTVYTKRPAATGASRSVLLVWMGANNYQNPATYPASTYIGLLETYWSQARTDGFSVIVAFTVMRRTGDSNSIYPYEKNRRDLNTAIRNSSGYDILIDVARLFHDPTDSTWFLPDGSHLNDAGNKRLAKHVSAALMSQGVAYVSEVSDKPLTPDYSMVVGGVLDSASISFGNAKTGFGVISPAIPSIGTGDYTVESWMKTGGGTYTTNFYALTENSGPGFGITGAGSVVDGGRVFTENGTAYSNKPGMIPGYWYHVAATRTGTTLRFYVNGVLSGTAADAANWTSISRVNGTGQPGQIARTRVFNYAKSGDQLIDSFQRLGAFDPRDTGCIYAMSDASNSKSGDTIKDLGPSGCGITLNGDSYITNQLPANSSSVVYGVAKVGTGAFSMAEFSSNAEFGNTATYHILADPAGDRYYNAKTGKAHNFRVNNSQVMALSSARLSLLVPIQLQGYTVATLPSGTLGDSAYVTDATAPTYNGTLTGGGTIKIPVFHNGTAWTAH